MPKFYTLYETSKQDFGLNFGDEPSLARQSEADSADINKIMERFDRTGQLPISMKAPPQYGDARIVDFQTAKQIVIDAEQSFAQLSAKARQYFGHNPENLLSAISDTSEENARKLIELGILIEKQETPEDVLKRIAQNTEATQKNIGNSAST